MNALTTAAVAESEPPAVSAAVASHRQAALKIGAVLAALVAVACVLKAVGPILFDIPALRESVATWGWRGVALYVAAFAVRDLTRVPGFVMAGLAIVAFGGWFGPALAYVGAAVSATCGFAIARFALGGLLAKCRSSWIAWLIDRVHAYPLRTVVIARSCIGTTAAINAPLAMSAISWRTYVAGTLIGLVPYVAVLTVLTRWSLG